MKTFVAGGIGVFRRRGVRQGLAGAVTVLVVGGLLMLGAPGGYPATRPQLLSGAAWLASAQVGQMTLLDGSSAEVAAQVQVANRGDRIEAIQQGANGYAVNRTSGTVRRIDGATFEVTPPAAPLAGAKEGLRAIVGADTLYALDSNRGVLTTADPKTLKARGAPVPLATQISPQAAALDRAGRLWVLDTATGDLVWIERGRRHSRRGVATPNAGLLVLGDGVPVIVDTARRTATALDESDGTVRNRIELDLRGDDRIEVSGSPHSARFYLVTGRGVLAVCGLTATTCANAVPLDSAKGSELGAPVESGGRLFVPDYTTGKVWIVDLRSSRVVAQPSVLDPNTRFQLLTRDSVVFFNDPESEHAGVIRLDGGVRQIRKYDPKDPAKGVNSTRPQRGGPTTQPPTGPPTTQPPAQPPTGPPSNRPSAPPSQDGRDPNQNRPPQNVRISVSKPSAEVNEDVTVRVVAVTGAQPTEARWNFGDGGIGTGLTATHRWRSQQTFQVSVVATFADGRTATASISIVITEGHARLTVTVSGTGGTVSGAGIACPPNCTVTTGLGQPVTLTAAPAQGFEFAGWSGACSGTALTCGLVMDADQQVAARFRAAPPPALPAPVLTSPANNALLRATPPRVSFQWQQVANAATYIVDIECDCDRGAWQLASTGTTAGDTWVDGASGRWRVRAVTADQREGTPSAWWTFRYDTWNGLAGNWVNANANTDNITRVTLTATSDTTATLQVWGQCSPTDCPWGPVTATRSGDTLLATYDHGYSVKTLRISRRGSQLVVQMHNDFTEADGRTDYDSTDLMNPG